MRRWWLSKRVAASKMVISRPREHLARGRFNSGRMIAPSRSFRTAPLFFSVCLCLSGPRDATRFRVRTRYTSRPCDFHLLASLSQRVTALLSLSLFRSLARSLARLRLPRRVDSLACFFLYFFPHPSHPPNRDSFSPLKLFRWRLLLVSIDLRSWYTKLSDRH
jgi:hypothetical protein